MGGRRITKLIFADDTTRIESAIDLMQKLLNKVKEESQKFRLQGHLVYNKGQTDKVAYLLNGLIQLRNVDTLST